MKKTKIFVMMIVALVGFVLTVHAEDQGNKVKGKYLYRGIYKSAHEKDPSVSAKPPLNPDSKTMAQWKKVFDTKDFAQFGSKDAWDKLSDKDLKDICAYLVSGAADSPTPAKCK
jgi:hypothetical protein